MKIVLLHSRLRPYWLLACDMHSALRAVQVCFSDPFGHSEVVAFMVVAERPEHKAFEVGWG